MRALIALALLLVGCGSSAVSPSPQPSPSPVPIPSPAPAPTPSKVTITATLTATVTGASAGTFTADVDRLPALVSISAAGYLTRQAYVGQAAPRVDLIALAAPFDLGFYRQLARGNLEDPTRLQPLLVLSQAPAFYLQTVGLSAGNIDRLNAAAREIVPAMTGGRFTVSTFETGPDARPQREGWVVVQLVNEPDGDYCGRTQLGAAFGQIILNTASCGFNGDTIAPVVFQHEIGHALGFWHVDQPGSLMHASGPGEVPLSQKRLSDAERYHAAIAYSRSAGNRDPDNDAVTSTPLSVRSGIVVID